ncbi:MAG: DegV family protein [Oscillospiraceae bacterium]|nr:DegV family protein [Oscillospiraceae bacterium]
MKFEIITDTASGLSYKYVTKNNVKMVSFKYYFGDNEHDTFVQSNDEDWLREFYAKLRKKESANTSMINSDAFITMFTDVLNKGKDFIYLAFSSALSGTCETARAVMEKLKPLYPDRKMYVFDTKSAAQGLGLNVDFAVRQRDKGDSIEQVYQWQVDNTLKICHWFTVDDLFFLKRGGRISGATAVAGTVLGIKPVMHVNNEGKLIKVGTERGRKAALDALVKKFGDTAISPENQRVFIGHGDCADDMKYVQKQLKDKFNVKEFETGFVNPVIGVHSGPGTMTVFFYGNSRE